ncbi:SWF or SNF family helicase [Streptomyces sp. DH12]|uniref:SWIM zinc finger family protein n=1 Tax=Streptomyces sp. DH12 TaxID=2857010 RepID=UPI001E3D858B|nr:SWF or SNF family helicase [Streptomyces sp. DH12]
MSGTEHEDEATYAALPPARGRGFAETWWGLAWLRALEDSALDGRQLRQGRVRARAGAVGAVTVRPGRITAVVTDRDGTAHRADVLVPRLPDGDWQRFAVTAAARAGHVAALLDRDVPPHLVEDAAAAGVDLLPGTGELEAECGCGAWDHCPHTAALCYQVARFLDRDPFVLLLVRGRGERRLLAELTAGGTSPAGAPAGAGAGAGESTGVRADEAFAMGGILPALPGPPPVPEDAGEPPSLATGEDGPGGTEGPGRTSAAGEAAGDVVDAAALEVLAADAAVRARRMLAEALGAVPAGPVDDGPPDVRRDAVRLAATTAAAAPGVVARLAEGTGRDAADMAAAVRAWRLGGAPGLAVLEGEHPPAPDALARAEALLARAWEGPAGDGAAGSDRAGGAGGRPALRALGGGRWEVPEAGAQLRLGRDGRWWPYRREDGRWTPAGPAGHDPGAVLAGLLEGDDLG